MGQRGPVPNRSEDLARPRERRGGDAKSPTKGISRPAKVPNAPREWHPIARRLWDSVKESGQTDFYESSDYALLYSLCDDLSEFKNAKHRSAQMAQTLYSALGNLLVTEGDRRRAGIELNDPEPDTPEASVLAIADYKKDLGLDD